jgi:hypothetical protein
VIVARSCESDLDATWSLGVPACSTCAGVKSMHALVERGKGGKWGLLWEGAASKQG